MFKNFLFQIHNYFRGLFFRIINLFRLYFPKKAKNKLVNSIKTNLINLELFDNTKKDNVILDKTCPRCNKLLINKQDFCDCGFFLKAFNNSTLWGGILSITFITGIILIIGLVSLTNVKSFASQKFKKDMDFNSLSPINIQVISSLKKSPYDGYIQNIYVKPKEKDKLMILVKPTLWHTLTKKEKEALVNQVSQNWKIIYKRNNPDSTEEPIVKFANFN
ncbi:MAG: hypothetical protein ACD_20C00435G0006 [uncultured bacterium]|nr:MAG: hypothetical protein ACD_20C00435G0006 [uncultured bacterium]